MPLGVIYDLYYPQNNVQPWKITIRVRDFPSDKLIRCNTREAAEKLYLQSLKQALYVLQGNTRSFNALILEQQQLLWSAANSGNREEFESISNELIKTSSAVKCIPVRLLLRSCTKKDNSQAIQSTLCIQRPVYAFKDQLQGEETELVHVLQQFAPEMNLELATILVQGINIPLNTPILSLWRMCYHADLFLYIVALV